MKALHHAGLVHTPSVDQSFVAAAGNGIAMPCSRYQSVSVFIATQGTNSVVNFEVSSDGATWTAFPMQATFGFGSFNLITVSTSSANCGFVGNVPFGATFFRTRVSAITALTTRTLTGFGASAVSYMPTQIVADGDALANNNTTAVTNARAYGYNGATWDRLRASIAGGLVVDTELPAAAALADATANPTTPTVAADDMLFNGTTWDRARNNSLNISMGDTGAKTVTFNGATQTNHGARGALIYVPVTPVSGTTPTMSVRLQVSLDGGGSFFNIGAASGNLTVAGQMGVLVYPSNLSDTPGPTPTVLASGFTVFLAINAPLLRTWRLTYTIGGTTPSFTLGTTTANYII